VKITEEVAAQILRVVDEGLTWGAGKPAPGHMCVEAAISYAFGEPHGDQPSCVSRVLRVLTIGMNEALWSNDQERGRGLRRIAIAQLGTAGMLDEQLFMEKLSETTITTLLPKILDIIATAQNTSLQSQLFLAAERCANEGTFEAADAAIAVAAKTAHTAKAEVAKAVDAAKAADVVQESHEAAVDAARAVGKATASIARWARSDAARDQLLSEFAETVVQILTQMQTPGSAFLFLTQPTSPSTPRPEPDEIDFDWNHYFFPSTDALLYVKNMGSNHESDSDDRFNPGVAARQISSLDTFLLGTNCNAQYQHQRLNCRLN